MRWDTMMMLLPALQLGAGLVWGFMQLASLRQGSDRPAFGRDVPLVGTPGSAHA